MLESFTGGPQGPQGPTGAQGDTGAAGPQGPQGDDGPTETAASLLAKLLTVDGAGSGLDADLLDGMSSAAFAAASHSHTASQVTDFSEAVDDRVNALLVEGAGIDLTYDDGANTLTIAATGGAGGVGPMGPAGMDGADGIDGAPGPAGSPGSAGAQGAQGAQGSAGGGGGSAVMGPPGMDGADGAEGPSGPPGTAGAQGAQGAQGAAGSGGTVATQAEMEAATNDTAFVSPLKMRNYPGVAKGWIYYNGLSNAIAVSHNVTSVTDNGTGNYSVNWNTDFSTANHCVVAFCDESLATTNNRNVLNLQTVSAGVSRFNCVNASGTAADQEAVMAVAFGDQA